MYVNKLNGYMTLIYLNGIFMSGIIFYYTLKINTIPCIINDDLLLYYTLIMYYIGAYYYYCDYSCSCYSHANHTVQVNLQHIHPLGDANTALL